MAVKMDYDEGNSFLNKSFGTVARRFLELLEDKSDDEEQTFPKSKASPCDVVLKTSTLTLLFRSFQMMRTIMIVYHKGDLTNEKSSTLSLKEWSHALWE